MSVISKFRGTITGKGLILNLLPFIVAILTFILVRLAVKHPQIVESFYSDKIYPLITRLFSPLSGLFSFSLWDTFWVMFGLLLFGGLVAVIMRKVRFWKYLLRALQAVAILYAAFYLLWGFNYFRPGIGSRLDWESYKPDEVVFRQILDTLINKTNTSRVTIYKYTY
jgi:hypothetical protein